MKVFVLKEEVFAIDNTPYSEIIGVYENKEDAKKEMNKTINDNIKNFDFVRDEEEHKKSTIIFYKYQENWDNYIEYEIIEKEVL